ncbi:Gfo/Idh/MocA family oxidoreductase [Actinomycetaceae bacterium MB13-C1-2]|nr:Gfo/Idh/MocA family oxidoreductase [Actinomycetaceae bacterium MB13-C1-2]
MKHKEQTLRVGIVGTNFISDWFVDAARRTSGRVTPLAIYSRSIERAQEFGDRNGLTLTFDNYQSMVSEVDAVYVASPTTAHFGQALAAVQAGRHVLVEKTMTSSLDQTAALFQAAEENGVVAMEATRSLYTPAYRMIQAAIPSLSELRYAHFEKLQYSSRYQRFLSGEHVNAFEPSMGNSSLIDLGVYCLEPAMDLLGTPESVNGSAVLLNNGFEAVGSLQLTYPGMVADIAYSKIAQGAGASVIVGEDGSLEINDIAETSRVVRRLRGGEPEVLYESSPVTPKETMTFELEKFADQVMAGETDPHWREVTLSTRKIMDQHLTHGPVASIDPNNRGNTDFPVL